VWVEAEIKLGEERARIGKAKGTRGQFIGRSIVVPPDGDAPSAKELGIAKRRLQRAEKLAAMPPKQRKACELVGIEPAIEVFDGDDPVAFILSTNARTRHMNESQRSMVAAGLANMPLGGAIYRSANLPTDPNALISQESAGSILNVSNRTIRHAVVVRATDELCGDGARCARRNRSRPRHSPARARDHQGDEVSLSSAVSKQFQSGASEFICWHILK
jgi:hypothetical protein